MYVLSPSRVVLAQYPQTNPSLIGTVYAPPDGASDTTLQHAYNGDFTPLHLSVAQPDGNLWLAVPILQDGVNSPVGGVLVLSVTPPPPSILTFLPVLLGTVLITGILLLLAVAPFGALFGWFMSRGLTRRLALLSTAADAWSEGNFSVLPQDRSGDEISALGMRLRHMAERIQDLLRTQQELAMLEERNRLARELHDTVKQQNFASLMQIRRGTQSPRHRLARRSGVAARSGTPHQDLTARFGVAHRRVAPRRAFPAGHHA